MSKTNPTEKELNIFYIRNYIKREKPRALFKLKQEAERSLETAGLGFFSPSGIFNVNLMDNIIYAYIDGHYIACIALCRSVCEIVLRERAFFQWFLKTKTKDIQGYINLKLGGHYDPANILNTVRLENTLNRLAFEFYIKQRANLDAEFYKIEHNSTSKKGKSRTQIVVDMPLGPLIDYCKSEGAFDDVKEDKEFFKTLKTIKEDGNLFLHGKYLKPPKVQFIFAQPILVKDPQKTALELIASTSWIVNKVFWDYDSKLGSPKFKLFKLNKKLRVMKKQQKRLKI
jgi:hypothetical protein